MSVLFSCVAENRDDWFDRVLLLSLSIRRLGGSLATAPVVVNFVDGVHPSYADRLAELDVDVAEVERVDPTYPYANKLRMLELSRSRPFDLLVALDCDAVVVGDVSPFVRNGAVSAKPADVDFLRLDQWDRLLGDLGLAMPKQRVRTTTSDQQTIPYVNSGVVLVPGATCAPLFELWLDHVYRLQGVFERHPDIAEHRAYTDQMALACSLVAGGIPLRTLPVTMNFPTHLKVHPRHWRADVPPRVIHYHNRVDEAGFLRPTRYTSVNQRIDALNVERAGVTGVPYRGLAPFGMLRRMAQDVKGSPWMHRPLGRRAKRAARRVRDVLARSR